MGFPGDTVVKNLPTSAGDTRDEGLIPGLKRSPGVGNGNLPQYFCLKNPMDRGAWRATVHGVAKSQTQPSVHAHLRMHTHTHTHTLFSSLNFKETSSHHLTCLECFTLGPLASLQRTIRIVCKL